MKVGRDIYRMDIRRLAKDNTGVDKKTSRQRQGSYKGRNDGSPNRKHRFCSKRCGSGDEDIVGFRGGL